ncbi:MAG TPA: hypothetical protein VFW83_00670 [Bryobacteraceae bacterium]|nr:hypothetical protein [Bryobacteraceae bacterium]
MKRGLIAWDKAELPPEAFEARLSKARQALAERDLPALIVYSDVWRSNWGRHFANFMPYWNRALLAIPADDKPVLLCSLSPRVYPWIKSVTVLEEIKPSPNLSQRVFEMCSEKGWSRIGVLDLPGLPYDLYARLSAGPVQAVDVPVKAVHPGPDAWEISMHRRALKLAREIVAEELPGGPGLTDHEFAGRLERKLRRAGAEDLVILVTNGDKAPAPARGAILEEGFSVAVALEYRGHWIKLTRPHRAINGADLDRAPVSCTDGLSGPYPFESLDSPPEPGHIFARHVEIESGGRRLFYGDTYLQADRGAELL